MVTQFNETYKSNDICENPTVPGIEDMKTWGNLIVEELQELAVAHDKKDPVEFLDAIADIIYVTAQQAQLYGWPLDAALREVHRSNMSKLGKDGKPIIREDGKVLKGPGFSEPVLGPLLNDVVVVDDGSVIEELQKEEATDDGA